MAKLSTILDQIDAGSMLLPEFQRGYVWNRDQVRGLMRSLYRSYPVGTLLIWETDTDAGAVRGHAGGDGVKQLLLDGQQRITSLYGVVRGKPPAFFEGNHQAFTGLRFNVEDETFEFYAPAKMRGDARWVDVTDLYVNGMEPQIEKLDQDPACRVRFSTYVRRLSRLDAILERDFHAEKIAGVDKGVDEVVDIFNKVNSGGTRLSKGDLALARACAKWPDARARLRHHLGAWLHAGYDLQLDWLLRNLNAVATGRAPLAALGDLEPETFRTSLDATAKYIAAFLDLVAARLGLDHGRVLMGRYAIPVVSRFQHLNGGSLGDTATQSRLLFWFVHSALWGRFTGSTETILAQDYETLATSGVPGLIASLERWRGGNLTVSPHDFRASSVGSRFYPLLYLLTRVGSARDFGNGLELRDQMLGRLASLQVHHIFPKAQLYARDHSRAEVNSVANFCFLTQASNLAIGKRLPQEYFPEVEAAHPGVLASQWVPMDRRLWRAERYLDFLEARRDLLSAAANGFLATLRDGESPVTPAALPRVAVVGEDADEDPAAVAVRRLAEELTALGMAEPDLNAEIADPETGRVLAVAEAYWPSGLQEGLGQPVVLELDPDEADLPRLQELGYDVYTSVDALAGFVHRRLRMVSGDVPTEATA